MSVLTGFYKKLMTYSFFRKKAIARLVESVKRMDTPSGKAVSAGKRDWLEDAKRASLAKVKPGLYVADLMLNNEVLPECEFKVVLELTMPGKFRCYRKFAVDDVLMESVWSGTYDTHGAYLLLDADFYFRETKVSYASRGSFVLKVSPGTAGPVIRFSRALKKDVELYKSKLSVG